MIKSRAIPHEIRNPAGTNSKAELLPAPQVTRSSTTVPTATDSRATAALGQRTAEVRVARERTSRSWL